MVAIILWIGGISVLTIFASSYAKKYGRPDALFGLYNAVTIFSIFSAAKIAEFDLFFTTASAPSGVLVFSITFLLTDVVNEKFGKTETHRMVNIALLSLVATSFFSWLVVSLRPAPFWHNQKAIELVIGQAPRIVVAGWLAFLASENLDVFLYDLFKRITKGRYLWTRNVISSFPAMVVDSVLFATVAFYGKQPLWPIIRGVVITKWLVGVINIPFMYLNRFVLEERIPQS